MFHRVSTECILSSDTLISHECAHIRDRPTLKDAERFRTGSMIHEWAIPFNIGTPLLRGLDILWGGGGFYFKIS